METQRTNEMKEQLDRIEASINNVDTLVGLKHNILDKKIDKLHDRFNALEDLTCQIADELLELCKKQERVEDKLDRIIAYIDKVESPQYQQALDNKEILINLLANAVITKLFAMFNNGQNQMQ